MGRAYQINKGDRMIQTETTTDADLFDKIQDTKRLRVEIDRNIQFTKTLAQSIDRGAGGRECALVVTKLQEAQMWAGKELEALQVPLPEEFRDEYKGEDKKEK